jgi:hypothetical protein
MTDIPIARIQTISYGETSRFVTVECPHCDEQHTHGWPYGDANVGHRLAHCTPGNPGYEISIHRR